MQRRPSLLNKLSKRLQAKINGYIPEKVHTVIAVAIRQMIKGVLFGAMHTTRKPAVPVSLQATEAAVENW